MATDIDAQLVNILLRNLTETQDALNALNAAVVGAITADFEQCETEALVAFVDLSSTLVKCTREGFGALILVPTAISLLARQDSPGAE